MKRRTLVMLKEGEMNAHENNPEKPLARRITPVDATPLRGVSRSRVNDCGHFVGHIDHEEGQ